MEWQQLEHFKALAEVQHFTRAAEKLSLSQPALSRSIAKLEAELGVLLLERDGRTVRLSRYGEQFAKRVDRILGEMEAGKTELLEALDPDSGTVVISFLKSLGISAVPALLSEFLALRPRVRFQLYQDSTRDMLDRLEQREVDFAISAMTEARSGVAWADLWQEQMYAYVPRHSPLASQAAVSLQELAEHPFIALKKGYSLRTITDNLFGRLGLAPRIMFEGEEVMTAVGLIAAGLGVSILPDVPIWCPDKVIRLTITDPDCRRTIGLAWKTERRLSPAAEGFRAFLLGRRNANTAESSVSRRRKVLPADG
ncbi:LysR family transcriptional regulator [Paenibacillus ferrarius]|uniref:LysR family transcriptional regulator n=1 Tax=Paenibacillus ferrarius TaxID=1469647 RepID=UPI003D2B6118